MFSKVAPGCDRVMRILPFSNRSFVDSRNIRTETSRQVLGKQLARVIVINLTCLVFFVALCAIITFGSLFRSLTLWDEHRAASVVVIMIAIVSIPSLVEFTASRLELWQA